jgi:hypothetical protein
MARAKGGDVKSSPDVFQGTGGVVRVNGKGYAAGLVWEGVSDVGRGAAQARAAADENGADLVCMRLPAKIQYGLGAKSAGHKSGMAPLASGLAEVIEGSFVGAFAIDDGYYLVAAREDQILAGCDVVVADAEEAQERFQELYVAQNWQQVIAPKEWGIDAATTTSLDDVLTGHKPKSTLTAKSKAGLYIKIAGALVVVAGCYFAYGAYEAHELQVQQEEQERQEAADRAAAAAAEAAELAKFKMPKYGWEDKPYGVPLIEACRDAIMSRPITAPGWRPLGLTCTQAAVSLALTRDGGTANWVHSGLDRGRERPDVVEVAGGVLATWPLALDAGSYDKDSKTGKLVEERAYLSRQFEEIFMQPSVRIEDGPIVQLPGKTATSPKVNAVLERHLVFSFQTNHDPREFLRLLAPIPALTVSSVKLDLANWTWTIEGTAYEKLDVDLPGAKGGKGGKGGKSRVAGPGKAG